MLSSWAVASYHGQFILSGFFLILVLVLAIVHTTKCHGKIRICARWSKLQAKLTGTARPHARASETHHPATVPEPARLIILAKKPWILNKQKLSANAVDRVGIIMTWEMSMTGVLWTRRTMLALAKGLQLLGGDASDTAGIVMLLSQSQCAHCRTAFSMDDEVAVLPCNHCYHPLCLASDWFKVQRARVVCQRR